MTTPILERSVRQNSDVQLAMHFKLILHSYTPVEYRYHYSCCRDGKPRKKRWTERKTETKRGESGKKPSRKLNDVCISRIYATVRGRHGNVKVTYIQAHTNHTLSIKEEAKHLPLPQSTRNEVAAKLQSGISVKRIMEGIHLDTQSYYSLSIAYHR